MDEFTLGTSTILCMMFWPLSMKVERVYGQLAWFRGVPLVFIPEELGA